MKGQQIRILYLQEVEELQYRVVGEAVAGDVVGIDVSRLTIRDLRDCRIAFRFIFEVHNLHSIIVSENADNLRIKIFMVRKNKNVKVGSDLTLFCYTTTQYIDKIIRKRGRSWVR